MVLALLLIVFIVISSVFFKRLYNQKNNKDEITSLQQENAKMSADISNMQTQINDYKEKLNEKEKELKNYNLKNIDLSNDVTRAKKAEEYIKEKLEEKNTLIQEQKQKIEGQENKIQTQTEENTTLKGEIKIKENRISIFEKQEEDYKKLQKDFADLQDKYRQSEADLRAEKEKNKNLSEQLSAFRQDMETQRKQNEEYLKNSANKILEETTKKFSESNTKEMSNIVSPLKEQINEFKKQIEDGNLKQTEMHTSLKERIDNMFKETNRVSREANNLANALKGENKRAGNWGEHVLETILQNSGLIKGEHYEAQQSVQTEENKRLVPDFIIHLPNDENGEDNTIVIDSKVSLVAYEKYFNAEDGTQQELYLKEHLQSVKSHIDELANKNYENINKGGIGFVMMFIPIEPACLLAMQSDVTLWEYAYKKKIILISATNMISCLRLIADLWKIDTRNKEAQTMADTCGKIYDKLLLFLNTFDEVGKTADRLSEQYTQATKQLKTGNANTIRLLEKLKNKGINSKTKRTIPPRFIEDIQEQEIDYIE